MKRSYWLSLTVVIVVAISATVFVRVNKYKPQYGLDLQGGSSIVLQAKGDAKLDTLKKAKDIILNRIDSLGVAEPDVSLEGKSIIIDLPGVTDEKRAEDLVGQTAQLTFRKVLGQEAPDPTNTTSTSEASTTTTTAVTSSTVKGAASTSGTTNTTTAATTTTTVAAAPDVKTTPREDSNIDAEIVLPESKDSPTGPRLHLDKPTLRGSDLSSANTNIDPNTGARVVDMSFKGGKATDTWKSFTSANVGVQFAIVLDGEIVSAPVIKEAATDGNSQISSGNSGGFPEKEANDLVAVLKYGALPVQLHTVSVQKVSATLGKDSLRAGLISGLVGLALVLLYIVFYYRALGIVTILGLMISSALLFSIICLLAHYKHLALSLSGITGIVVSVGVTVDSYIVYFEKLKDEIRAGRTVRSSVERGFKAAFRTILAADLTSLIGAAVLYLVSVGPVRGFALFLGISTMLDMLVAYFFTRPMVILLGQNRMFTQMRGLGIARGLATTEVDA